MRKIAVFYKKEDRKIKKQAIKVINKIKSMGIEVSTEKIEGAKLAVSIGGDGTLLRTAKKVAAYNIPVIGIHIGGLGFLNELGISNWLSGFIRIMRGKHKTDKRHFLEVQIKKNGNILYHDIGLNDAVITKSGIARVIKFRVKTPEHSANRYLADGLILSTATGSTAYNLSAGGPILKATSKSLVATPICPHQLYRKSLISGGPIKVTLERGDNVVVTVDGQKILPYKLGEEVVVKRSNIYCKFIRLKKYDQIKNLKNKMGRR